MASIWESLTGLQGLDEANIPWFGKLIAMIVNSQRELRPYMHAAYGRAPELGSEFDVPDELQKAMHRAQTEETTADPRLNPWLRRNVPDWVRPQVPSMVQELAGQKAPMQEMIMGLLQAGPETKVHYKGYPAMSPQDYLQGIPYPREPLRIQAPYSRAKRGYEMSELEAEERERGIEQRGFQGLTRKFPQQDIPTLQALKGIAGTEAVQRELYGDEPKGPTPYQRNKQYDLKVLAPRYNFLRRSAESGLLKQGSPEWAEYNYLQKMFTGTTTKAPKPMISSKELMNKMTSKDMMGHPIEITPASKFLRVRPFEHLAPAQADTAYEAHGMPGRELRQKLIQDINTGVLGKTEEEVRVNLSSMGFDEDVVKWLLKLTNLNRQ